MGSVILLFLLLPFIVPPTGKPAPQQEEKNKQPANPLKNIGLSPMQIEDAKKILNRMHRQGEELRKKAVDEKGGRKRKFYLMREINKIRKDAYNELKKIMTSEQFEEFQKRHQLPPVFPQKDSRENE